MANLNHTELKYLLIDSLRTYSEDVTYLSGNNPYKFSVNGTIMFIFIHNVHDSGTGRTNEDECRLQFSTTRNFDEVRASGLPVIFLGYHSETNTFTTWDPHMHTPRINARQNVSVYSRFSVVNRGRENGIAAYTDTRGQVVITFKPEYLGLYLENFESMHHSTEEELLQLIERSDEVAETEDRGTTFEIDRKRFTVTHRRLKRDAQFKKIVGEAYSQRCAVCGIQLELVEAAHIIPHSHDQGNDDPTNGVCMCVLHHKAYDNALIFIDEDYAIKVNVSKMTYLTKIHRDGGALKFTALQHDRLSLPTSAVHRPSVAFIREANRIRGVTE